MSCEITCDSETDFHHCIINYGTSSASNIMEQTYITVTFDNYNLPSEQDSCSCIGNNFAPINCFILRPTHSNTEVLATTIPFSTTTTTNTTNIATIVAPAVTVTTLLCISIAAGSALLCVLCMKKIKQGLATLHSDSKDQQKYNYTYIHTRTTCYFIL